MDMATLLTLAGIALLDSTSIGTLVIPLWLMLDTRRTAFNVVLYLATLSAFYFIVGAALLLGVRMAIDSIGNDIAAFFTTDAGGYTLVGAGAASIVASFMLEPKRVQTTREARGEADRPSWAERMGARSPRTSATIGLALAAGTIEVATMLPYLAAIGIIGASDLAGTEQAIVLAGYVTVMALPALVLLLARHAAGSTMTERLQRLRAWLMKHSAGTISILLLIIGINLAIRGAALLDWTS